MRIPLAHHIAAARRLVDIIAHGIARRNAQLAQEQNCGGGKVFAMAAAVSQQKAGERRAISGSRIQPLPGAVAKVARKKVRDRTPDFPGTGASEVHFSDHLG